LTIRSNTTSEQLRAWITGTGARISPFPEQPRTRIWRAARRARAVGTGKPGSDLITPVAAAAFRPARVLEIELGAKLEVVSQHTSDGTPYERALLLATLHGVPLGVVDVDLPPAGLAPEAIVRALSQPLAAAIARHCEEDGIETIEVGTPEIGTFGAPQTRAPCRREHERLLADGPRVSVAIATRDRHRELEACLLSLIRGAGSLEEIIVVDNAPTSPAAQVVDRVAAQTELAVRYELEPLPGLALAHNRALSVARGEIVAFLDDDVIVQPTWLPELLRAFDLDPDVACVTGAIIPAELETAAQGWLEQFGGFAKGFERQVFDRASAPTRGPLYPYAAGSFGSGANMAFRTSVLRSLGGFDPAIGAGTPAKGGDDLAAFLSVVSAGYTLVYQPTALVFHRHRRDYEGLRRTTFGYGVGLTAYLTKAVLDEPARLLDLVRAAPRGLAHGLRSSSPKHSKKQADYPRELTRRERYGMLLGPFAYLWSRWRRRHLAARPGRLDPS
jgi:GT2 family glycosyltransferase